MDDDDGDRLTIELPGGGSLGFAGFGDPAGVPCLAFHGTAEVGGAPPCLIELRMPACSAEPWLRTQLQPRDISRRVRHETQNMPLRRPRPARALPAVSQPGPHQCRAPASETPAVQKSWSNSTVPVTPTW
jgi:hypothetical protein